MNLLIKYLLFHNLSSFSMLLFGVFRYSLAFPFRLMSLDTDLLERENRLGLIQLFPFFHSFSFISFRLQFLWGEPKETSAYQEELCILIKFVLWLILLLPNCHYGFCIAWWGCSIPLPDAISNSSRSSWFHHSYDC